jgi:hypothetical protein
MFTLRPHPAKIQQEKGEKEFGFIRDYSLPPVLLFDLKGEM